MKIFRKKKILIPLIFLVIILFSTGYYLYTQEVKKIADERLRLTDQHCIAVNPLLIDTKTAYIGAMNSLLASDNASYISAQYSWLGSAKEYLALEKHWLSNSDEFIQRADVKQFMNSQELEALTAQRQIYLTEYKGIEQIVLLFKDKKNVNLKDLHHKMLTVEQETDIAQQAYNLRWGNKPVVDQNPNEKKPVSQCPEKNLKMPNIEDEVGI